MSYTIAISVPNLFLNELKFIIIEIIFISSLFLFPLSATKPFQSPSEVGQPYALSLKKDNENKTTDDVKNNINKENDCKCIHCVSCFECFYYIIRLNFTNVSL